MSESVYLYGVILLLLDQRIEGVVRERMLVCYLRQVGQNELSNLNEVCKLCSRTGYVNENQKRPPNYPELYFSRFSLPHRLLSMIIGNLRSDDIYSQIPLYPLPEHRSTALALQASMIYVCLYFIPNILNQESAIMREIVDKHFPDNWVIAWYLGFTVDLSVAWIPYKAASLALNNTIESTNIEQQKSRFVDKLSKMIESVNKLLIEGVLTEDFILERRNQIMGVLRESNSTLRWLTLHTRRTSNKKILETITKDFDQSRLFAFLLNLSQFEFQIKKMFQFLLDSKEEKWVECRNTASERMRELGAYFSGEMALVRIKKNPKLQLWFSQNLATLIDSLDYHEHVASTRKIQQLLQALEEVELFHEIETNLQVKQFLNESRSVIKKMLRIANLSEDFMISFSVISDCSYLFKIAYDYVNLMQNGIKKDPQSLFKLRSTFLKLSTMLQVPLVRINQCKSKDLISVSQYYSRQLVKFVRQVMDVIPKSMFSLLDEIIKIQTNEIKELPTQVEKDQMKEYAQLSSRFKLSETTYKISIFTRGISALETTFVGLITVDPKQLLEDGIRKELVNQISLQLHEILNFENHKIADFELKLVKLANVLSGFKRSFQYIQDYINIYGLKIWQEEFSRIIYLNVEQECNLFLKRKIFVWDSKFYNEAIPVPIFKNSSSDSSLTFVGRLARELLFQTMPNKTLFLERMNVWYDINSGREIVSLKTFNLLLSSISVSGLVGLDKLFSYMLVTDLKLWTNKLFQILKTTTGIQEKISEIVEYLISSDLPSDTSNFYVNMLRNTEKVWIWMPELISSIGHKQLLRLQISHALNANAKLDSNMLYEALHVFNEALINDIQVHRSNPSDYDFPDTKTNDVLVELSPYLEYVGLNSPLDQIYLSSKPYFHFDLIMAILTIVHLSRVQRDEKMSVLVSKSKGSIDHIPFVVGIWTVLKQYHTAFIYRYLAFIGQWIRAHVNSSETKDEKLDIPPQVYNALYFLEDFSKISKISRDSIKEYIPDWIFDDKKIV